MKPLSEVQDLLEQALKENDTDAKLEAVRNLAERCREVADEYAFAADIFQEFHNEALDALNAKNEGQAADLLDEVLRDPPDLFAEIARTEGII